jgi:hypothetical protein
MLVRKRIRKMSAELCRTGTRTANRFVGSVHPSLFSLFVVKSDCIVAKEVREEIQKLLVNPPITQVLHNRGPIVFGSDDLKKMERERKEKERREKDKLRVPKNAAERAGRID